MRASKRFRAVVVKRADSKTEIIHPDEVRVVHSRRTSRAEFLKDGVVIGQSGRFSWKGYEEIARVRRITPAQAFNDDYKNILTHSRIYPIVDVRSFPPYFPILSNQAGVLSYCREVKRGVPAPRGGDC